MAGHPDDVMGWSVYVAKYACQAHLPTVPGMLQDPPTTQRSSPPTKDPGLAAVELCVHARTPPVSTVAAHWSVWGDGVAAASLVG